MNGRRLARAAVIAAAVLVTAAPARAQSNVGIRGFATFGNMTFTAKDSFDAILGSPSGPIFGGGGQVRLPWFGVFVEVGASRFQQDGERVFVANGEVYRLGIPVRITITPIELTGGIRRSVARRIGVYGGGGYSAYAYKETSDFADPGENVDDRFTGFHVMAGADYQVIRWIAVGGEVRWATIPDALGEGGVSREFDEHDLGGTSIRLKVTFGR